MRGKRIVGVAICLSVLSLGAIADDADEQRLDRSQSVTERLPAEVQTVAVLRN